MSAVELRSKCLGLAHDLERPDVQLVLVRALVCISEGRPIHASAFPVESFEQRLARAIVAAFRKEALALEASR